MKILNSATCSLFLLVGFLWFPSSTGARELDVDAEVKKHLNDPVACGCSLQDDIDLKSRIASVNAVVAEFAAAKSKYAGSKQTLTSAIRSSVQQPVKQKINAVKDPKARDYGATTYDLGCFTIIDFSATPCLRGALDDHESVHRQACVDHSLGWRFDQLVEDWIQEEIDAYQKELNRLNAELNKRLPFCTLDPSVKNILWQIAEENERDKEAKSRLDLYWAFLD